MIRLKGKGIAEGIGFGTIKFLDESLTVSSQNLYEKIIIFSKKLNANAISKADKSMIRGICTIEDSSSSHSVIIAKSLGIPVILMDNIDLKDFDGKMGIIDGSTGEVFVEPDKKACAVMSNKSDELKEKQARFTALKGKETVTLDGKKINLFATANKISDLNSILENDAEGIGLFRSEFLFLNDNECPTEELQFQYYKRILERMGNKPVVIRTADIGGDKQADFIDFSKNNNPALNLRGIRTSLTNPMLFKIQLRALYRASIYGNLSIMFPMIISLEEVLKIKEIISQVKKELTLEEIPFNDKVPLGIMIETPSAAMISDLLAKEVDFFSIGTNDLAQYTLAVDRQTRTMESSFNPAHSSVMRLIELIIRNAHKAKIKVCICGQLSDDFSQIEKLIEMGADEISTSPYNILPIREIIRNYTKT